MHLRRNYFGWFDHAGQEHPTYDPLTDSLCPVCCQKIDGTPHKAEVFLGRHPRVRYYQKSWMTK